MICAYKNGYWSCLIDIWALGQGHDVLGLVGRLISLSEVVTVTAADTEDPL